jgi:hypothetical protein
VFTETVKVAGVVPPDGFTESQLPPLLVLGAAVNGSGGAELEELDMPNVCETGGAPFC